VVQVASEFGFASWLAAGMINLKIAEILAGDLDAIPMLEYCLTGWRAAGASSSLTQFGLGLALAYQAAGRTQDALASIDQAIHDASKSRELYLEPELHRVRGEVLAELQPDNDAGLVALEKAVATAAASGSRALELRSLLSIGKRRREYGDARAVVSQLDRLLARLDPTGDDLEPLLVQARATVGRESLR
jgi:tetratricopeptide (TPR) repeat protein